MTQSLCCRNQIPGDPVGSIQLKLSRGQGPQSHTGRLTLIVEVENLIGGHRTGVRGNLG